LRVITAIILVAALVGAYYAYRLHRQEQDRIAQQQAQLSALQDQLQQLQSQNQLLHQALNQVQQENNRLAATNDSLAKAIAQAKLTGKVPDITPLPYPPK
jgi:peptidoglycan hydrolase CwlO-like protein